MPLPVQNGCGSGAVRGERRRSGTFHPLPTGRSRRLAGGAKIFSVISASPLQGLFEERRHQIYGLGLGGFIEPLAVQFQHQIAFLGKGHLAERGVLLEVQRNRQALGILRVAPAQWSPAAVLRPPAV